MKKRKILTTAAAAVSAFALTVSLGGGTASAAEWSWANYGFSGTAIANPDPFDPSSYLIGGYVASINHQNPLGESYVYDADIIPDTEGVALRFRFGWVNTEAGYRAVADLQNGIAVYPMDESLDVAVVTESGVQRYSFPVPAAYDYMSVNDYTVKDNGSAALIEVCGKPVAMLKFDGTRTVGGATYFTNVTVTDANGYVYGRCTDSLVLASGGYAGYSSQENRALILVKQHTLSSEPVDITLPAEKETEEGWVPETEAPETIPETLPAPLPESDTDATSADEIQAPPQPETQPETAPTSETNPETALPSPDGGCASAAGGIGAGLLSAAAAAVVLGKKHHKED